MWLASRRSLDGLRNLAARGGPSTSTTGALSCWWAWWSAHGQSVACLTDPAVHLASATYRGEGKTDGKDAFANADQARIRRDVGLLRPDEIAVDPRTLTTRRLAPFDRTRQINRLGAQLLDVFPALERSQSSTPHRSCGSAKRANAQRSRPRSLVRWSTGGWTPTPLP
ncbi:IS110 family transposase [Streptomyces sp. 7R007]